MIPLWIRVVHWVFAVLFLLLFVTGITQHFATAQFSLMDYSIATTIHEVGGIMFSVVYVLFVISIFLTGYRRRYLLRGKKFSWLIWQQSKFYGRNPAIVFLLLPLLVITGLLYLYPYLLPERILGFDGLWTIAMVHYAFGVLGTAYTIGHIFMGTIRKIIFG